MRQLPRFTRTDTLFPDTTLFRSILPQSLLIRLPTLRMSSQISDLWPDMKPGSSCEMRISNWLTHGARAPLRSATRPRFALRYSSPLTRSEEHTSELQSLMRTSYAVFCLKQKNYTYDI